MRMRRRNNLAPRMEACESVWIHEPEALRGSWRSLMPGCRELRVEVGCGKGKFTVETAEAEPDVLLIAIERVQDALVLAMEAAIRKGLKTSSSSRSTRRTSTSFSPTMRSTCSTSTSAIPGRARKTPSAA